MRMETVNGTLRVNTETDEELRRVNALVETKEGPALEALLADLRPVFKKHGLDLDDEADLLGLGGGLTDGVFRQLVHEKLWYPAAAELFLGGRL